MVKKLKYHLVLFVFIQIALCYLYGYNKMYNARPYSIHQWRQTDCVSFTKNYYEEGMDFFHPKIHWQGVEGGKTISEFPLVNYTVACLWKVFGEHEYLYRFTILGIYMIAMLFLFVMIYDASDSVIFSYFGATLITTSPLLAYYSFSFLADVPALSFAIISLSLFFLFLKNKKLWLFVAAILAGTLATLLKASSVTVLLIIGLISLIHLINFPKKLILDNKLFANKLFPLLLLPVAIIILYLWYHYAYLYNNKSSNGVFLMETLPIWKMESYEKKMETFRFLYSIQFQMYFNRGVLIGLFGILCWMLLNLKQLAVYLQISLLVSFASFLAFIVLFFQVFDVHDYYLINTMILPVVLIACLGNYLKNISVNFLSSKLIFIFILVFGLNAYYCAAIVRLRNLDKDEFCKDYPFITNDEVKFSEWFHYNYALTIKPLETITPTLRSLGIQRTDKVLSIPDPSFNITLYLMDQKGYTATEQTLHDDTLTVQKYKDYGVKYVVLSDTSLLQKTILGKVLSNRIGTYQNTAIFKLN